MSRRRDSVLHAALLWLLIAAAAWPAFVLAASAIGLWTGEARQIDAWTLAPKRNLAADFVAGWIASAPFALALGAVAVVDYLLLGRYRVTWLIGGALLIASCAALAFAFGDDRAAALPTLIATGTLLALLHRTVEWLRSPPRRRRATRR